jgi:hypothetical protein
MSLANPKLGSPILLLLNNNCSDSTTLILPLVSLDCHAACIKVC